MLAFLLMVPPQAFASGNNYFSLSYENGVAAGIYKVSPKSGSKATLVINNQTYSYVETMKPVLKVDDATHYFALGKETNQKQALENPYSNARTQYKEPNAIGKNVLFLKFQGETEYAGMCGGGGTLSTIQKKLSDGKVTTISNDIIGNATGNELQVYNNFIYYTKVNKSIFKNYTLYKMSVDGKQKSVFVKSVDDFKIGNGRLYYMKDNKFYRMDMNGKNTIQLKSIKDKVYGSSPCDGPNYQFKDSGIFYSNDNGNRSIYDFKSGKQVELKQFQPWKIYSISENLKQFAVQKFEWETEITTYQIVDAHGKLIKKVKVPDSELKLTIDINKGTIQYFVKGVYYDKKY